MARRLTGPVAEAPDLDLRICVGSRDPATKPSRGCFQGGKLLRKNSCLAGAVAIPESLGRCAELQKPNLRGCEDLGGAIPESLGQCAALKVRWVVGFSGLSGAIPEGLVKRQLNGQLQIHGGWDGERKADDASFCD